MDAVQGRACDVERRAVVAFYAFDFAAHHGKRFHNAPHGAFLDGSVAGEGALKSLSGKNAADQSRGGAAVSHIQNGGGRVESVKSFSVNHDFRRSILNLYPHFPKSVYGGETVRPLQKVGNFRGAFGKGAEHDCAVGDGFVAGDGYFPS